MRYREALAEGTAALEKAGIETARLDAWYLLEHVCHITRQYFYLNDTDELKEEEQQEYELAIGKRAERVPLQYIIGEQEFMGLTFKVNPSVLIPRQDTEILVEEILKICKPDAKLNQTAVIFERSNLYEAFSGKFDVIVSNPPYIPSAEIPNLMPEVRDFEPHQALDGLEDGLYFYRKIIAGSVEYLNEDGILCLEIGCEQASAVTEMMKHFGFKDITVVQDLAGLDRVVRGHL